MSNYLLLLVLCPCLAFAGSYDDALKAREYAMQAFKRFNPATQLNDYTSNPPEIALLPNEKTNQLTNQGAAALSQHQDANNIYQQATSREKVLANPNGQEMRYAETLLDNPEVVLEGLIKTACTDGQCDRSHADTSDDIQEGLLRLGALAGGADDVRDHQVNNGVAAIFTGQRQECKKYPLGFRDCCTDSGWGDWVTHCPHDLQELQRAKHEHRVVYLGHYKKHTLGSQHYSYCIFPSKLAHGYQINR